MHAFFPKMALVFFTAFGIMLGACTMGSLAALLFREPPVAIMLTLAKEIKIWAVVAAIGGSFSTFEILESGILQGDIKAVVKQLFFILSSFAGAHLGYFVVVNLSLGKN
ncbi:MAG: YtrH family sporulation protein [Bacillota bacterium]